MAVPALVQQFDESLLQWARGTPSALVVVFVVLTTVGGGWGLFVLLPFLVRKSSRFLALWLLGAAVVTSTLVSLFKELFGRVRPCDALEWCSPLSGNSPGGHSFPSGHAAGSFTFAAFIAVRFPRFAAPAFLLSTLIAWSRCVLGVHYPSDVLAGALLGTAIGVVAALLSKRPRAAPTSAR